MDHSTFFDAVVAVSAFGNSAIGLIILIRQGRNARRQRVMHTQNQEAIATVAKAVETSHQGQAWK